MTTIATQVFRLPDLGEGLTEAGLVQWLVAVGDTITTDQAIAEVETAKSIVELPSPFAGTVIALHGEPGETINVGAPVLEVGDPDATANPATPSTDSTEHEAYRTEERAGSGNVLIGYGTTERAGRGRRRPRTAAAPQRAAAASAVAASIAASAVAPAPVPTTALPVTAVPPAATPPAGDAPHRRVAVRSPLVRRLARDLGLDLQTIVATGADGAITRADVVRAAVDHTVDAGSPTGGARVASAALLSGDQLDGLTVHAREKFSPMRKAVSATLGRSRSEIPEATVWVDVDATRLWNLRPEMAAPGEKAPSITALIARFTMLALAEYPLLASRLNEKADEITTFDGVNLGIAADTPRGLMVPVIPQAHTLSIAQLDARLRELAETARAGHMPPERLRGSTFTLNNYGGFGLDGSAAIINYPNVAILGIGRIIERPWVVDGEIVARRIAQLSLVFDHRVCDGGYAAGFLRRVVDLIEHPMRAFGQV